MEVESNAKRNFKDLEERRRSAKALKRNNTESSGILIGPSMVPRFFEVRKIPFWWISGPHAIATKSASGPN